MTTIEFHLDGVQILQFVIAIVLPLLVGLVTKRVTSSGLKAILLLALSAITSLLTAALSAAQNNTPFDLGAALIATLGTFIVGVAMHFGLWKPTGVADAAQRTLVTDKPGDDTDSTN